MALIRGSSRIKIREKRAANLAREVGELFGGLGKRGVESQKVGYKIIGSLPLVLVERR